MGVAAPPPGARPAPCCPLSGPRRKAERGGGASASPPSPAPPHLSLAAGTAGMFPAQEEADRTVFVGNLEARVREEILYELFLQVPSAGKAGRRLWSPGTPPQRSSGLPSFTWAHTSAAGSGDEWLLCPRLLCSPPGGPRPPSPALQPASPLVRAPRASAGPGWAAGTQYDPVPVLMG